MKNKKHWVFKLEGGYISYYEKVLAWDTVVFELILEFCKYACEE